MATAEAYFRTISTMWYRQIKRFLRAKSRVVGTAVQPVMWLVFFGMGLGGAMRLAAARPGSASLDYLSFMAPGVIMMSVFMTSFMSGISVIWDREFGFLKEVLVAPVPRSASILGRALGDTTTAVIQGLIILVMTSLLAPQVSLSGIPLAVAFMLMVSLTFTSMGIVLGSRMRSMEGFQLINTFLSMPLLFLSGAFYPLRTMPDWMRYLAYVDPLTYGVDGCRAALIGMGELGLWTDLALLAVLSIAFTAVSIAVFGRTTID